ncbi:hypothetical protein TCAP_01992 [Tolypocladium capitatum]|uniref:Uncharacterized protein n=1 Tax=Tolypocladium capitatum TaxID=45235 RepID=A0A2K3QKL4_9HYPO|nr:hypothetical protein TCAP_01992 [Tolypocladium capitatum]
MGSLTDPSLFDDSLEVISVSRPSHPGWFLRLASICASSVPEERPFADPQPPTPSPSSQPQAPCPLSGVSLAISSPLLTMSSIALGRTFSRLLMRLRAVPRNASGLYMHSVLK